MPYRKDFACKVCGNVPDIDGDLDHGRGCFTQSPDGGGYSYEEGAVGLFYDQEDEAIQRDAARMDANRQPGPLVSLSEAWKQVEFLVEKNAFHLKKKFFLQDATPYLARVNLDKELSELNDAPEDLSEVGDMVAILLHYCLMHGWTETQLTSAILEKLAERYTLVPPPEFIAGDSVAKGV